ncbi:unnamed protein product, partial [marine sediment metagenome]
MYKSVQLLIFIVALIPVISILALTFIRPIAKSYHEAKEMEPKIERAEI